MRLTQKMTVLLVSFMVLLGIILTGCSNTSKTSSNNSSQTIGSSGGELKGNLSFAYWGSASEHKAIQSAVDDFQKKYPDVKVDSQWIQQDYLTKLQTMIAGGTVPDVVLISGGDFPGFVNAFTEVNVSPSNFSSDSLVKTFSQNGKTYATPFIIKPKVMAINTDLFKKNNIPLPSKTTPMTPEQFKEDALKIMSGSGQNKIYGSEQLWLGNWIYSFGGSFYSKDGKKSTLGSPKSLEAAQFIVDSKKLGYVPSDNEAQGQDMMNWFLSGRLGMYTDFGPWYLPQMKDVTKFNWDLVPFPGNGGAKEVDGLAISKNSNNKKLAAAFINFMCESKEAQTTIGGNAVAYGIPVLKEAESSFEKIYPSKNLGAFINAAENQQIQETQKQTNQINSALKAINDDTPLGTGKENVSKVLPQVDKKIDEILQQSN